MRTQVQYKRRVYQAHHHHHIDFKTLNSNKVPNLQAKIVRKWLMSRKDPWKVVLICTVAYRLSIFCRALLVGNYFHLTSSNTSGSNKGKSNNRTATVKR